MGINTSTPSATASNEGTVQLAGDLGGTAAAPTATGVTGKAVAVANLADGTDGELITWDSSGVAAAVAAGSSTEVLTSNGAGAAPTFQAGGGGGGQTLYTLVVAASGGDHTTLGAAITAASAGDSIFVRGGTYSESAISSATADLHIVGDSRDKVIIDMQGNALTLSGADVAVRDLTIKSADALATFSGANQRLDNVRFDVATATSQAIDFSSAEISCTDLVVVDTGATGTNYTIFIGSTQGSFTNCSFTLPCKSTIGAIFNNGTNISWTGCIFQHNGTGSAKAQMKINNTANSFVNCSIIGDDTDAVDGLWVDATYTSIMGCKFQAIGGIGIIIDSNFTNVTGCTLDCVGNGIELSTSNCSIVGNVIWDAAIGIDVNGGLNYIAGNNISGVSGVHVDVASGGNDNMIVDNIFAADTSLVDASPGTTWRGNKLTFNDQESVFTAHNREFVYAENSSGGALAAGDIVTLKATAAGNEVTTTTAQGDDLVFGMATETIANLDSGSIQVGGYTTLLKVDGTTDIAIGDFIGTFTTAKIGQKAASGDMAIAIALEAYTTDDSSGVLNGILITPRKI